MPESWGFNLRKKKEEEMPDVKPLSDEEMKGIETCCDAIETAKPPMVHAQVPVMTKAYRRFLGTIATDRQQIENLKLDLHIANRALEIDLATVDLRKRIAELEEYSKNKENRFHRCSGRGDAILPWHQIVCSLCLPNSPDSNFDPVKYIAELEKQAKIKDTLAEGVMTLAEVYEQLEDAKAENQRLRDLLLEAIKWVDKYDWNQARGLEYKLKQALRPQGEEKK